MVCEKDESGEYIPDWGVTVIFKTGKEPANYEYYEQDGIRVSLHNYLAAIGQAGADSDELDCIIKIEDEDE